MRNKSRLVFFVFLASIITGLFTQITYSEFERVSKKSAPSEDFRENRAWSIPLAGNFPKAGEVMILSLKVENEEPIPKRIEVFLNSSRRGVALLKAREVKEFHLELRNDAFDLTDNTVSLRGDGAWKLLNYKISNIYGYSRGLIAYIVIPKATRTFQRPGVFVWLPVFLILFLLGVLSPLRTAHLERLVLRLARFVALSVTICLVLLPFVSRYRLLLSFQSLWIFFPFLYLSATLRLSRILYQKCPAAFRFFRLSRGPAAVVSSRQSLAIAFFFSGLVFLFFYHVMLDHLKVYHGNFSGFVSLRQDLVSGINPVFWNASPELLFENSDFEKGTLENWTARGNAFRFQPTRGANVSPQRPDMPFNYQGQYWVGTSQKYQGRPGEERGTKRGDRPHGTLTSVAFIIKEERIGFLIGGKIQTGKNLVRESVGLEVNGEIVRETTCKNRDMMELQVWDVAPWKGRSAHIIITDSAVRGPGRGHINADWFHYYKEDRMSRIQENLLVSPTGYDAQFFYFMTYDPLLLRFKGEPRKYRVLTDEPRYRYERIAFPLLTKVISLDRPELYPRAMMALILLSCLLGAFFLIRIVQFFGQSPLWGLVYILVPGYQVSLARALPESLVMAFLLAGFYFYLKGKIIAPGILFSISLLTRETAALAVIPLILWEFFKQKNPRKALILSVSFLPLIGWKLYLTFRLFDVYGWTTLFVGSKNLSFPFSGIIELYRRALARSINPALLPASIAYPLLLVFLFFFSLYLLWKRRDFLSLSLGLFSLIAVSLSYSKVWIHIDNAVRTTTEPFLFLVIVLASQKISLKKPLARLALGFFVLVLVYDFYLSTFHDFFRAGFFLK